jgi:hypothetical protein
MGTHPQGWVTPPGIWTLLSNLGENGFFSILVGVQCFPLVSNDELSHRSHDAARRHPPITDRAPRHAGWKHGATALIKNGRGQV